MKIIVKLGTNAIFDSINNKIKTEVLKKLAIDASNLIKDKNELIVVTSGAVGLGKTRLNGNGKNDVASRQACAAVGQPMLMSAYGDVFSRYNLTTAQFLLTSEDLTNQLRLENLRQAYSHYLNRAVIPIVNENDTTATEELTFGDNDYLSLQLLLALNFDTLINFTEKGALIRNKKIVSLTNIYDSKLYDSLKKSGNGFGGLSSKLAAAEKATRAGKQYIIAKAGDSILEVLEDKKMSTRFYI
jgi:glutamate 5-kinase